MNLPSLETMLTPKLLMVAGLVILLLAGGAYFFFGTSGKISPSDQSIQEAGSPIQNIEAAYASAQASSAQRNEFLLSEGDSKTFNGQTLEVVKIGKESIQAKSGNDTKILGSGKDYSFGAFGVRILAVTFSNDSQYRKVIIRFSNSDNSSEENATEAQGPEFTLGEGEAATFESATIKANTVDEDQVSVTVGPQMKTILNGEWSDFGNLKVEVETIFYTGEKSESRVVLRVTY